MPTAAIAAWEDYCERAHAAAHPAPAAPTAMQQAEAMFAALGAAERRADAAMWARGRFDPLSRNLHQLWLMYAWTSRHQREHVAGFRRQLRRAIAVYRQHRIAETRGIDTSGRRLMGETP